MKVIHETYGLLNVVKSDEATYWLGGSQWYCPDDPELGFFDSNEFVIDEDALRDELK